MLDTFDILKKKSNMDDTKPVSTPAGGRGGRREGAGRPPGSMNKDNGTRLALKRKWLERINLIADKIFDAHEDSALGHFQQVMGQDGKVRVYKKPPNPMSLEWMMEHIWGRAPQKLELEGEIRTPEVITTEMQAALKIAILYAIPKPKGIEPGIAGQGEPLPRTDEIVGPPDPRPAIPKGADA